MLTLTWMWYQQLRMHLFQKSKNAFSGGVPAIPKDPLLLFHAFLRLAKERNRPKNTEIIFVGLVDEEFGQAGSRTLAQKGPKANLAIAGEPTNLKVVSAHKGNLWIKLSTKGKGRTWIHSAVRKECN